MTPEMCLTCGRVELRRGCGTIAGREVLTLNYYISVNGAQRGPFALEQLAAQGLRPDSMVWAEGMAQWERADRVPALLSIVANLGAAPASAAASAGAAQA